MANFDYKKMHDFVNADPELKKLREARLAAHKKIDQLNTIAATACHKQNSLYKAYELVIRKQSEISSYTDEQDEAIEEVTGHGSDEWGYEWNSSAEVLLEGLLGHAIVMADIAHKIEECNKDVDDMGQCVAKMKKTLEEQYLKQINKKEKSKQTNDV